MASPSNKKTSIIMVVLAFATVYVVWGSTYLFIQKAIHGFPPFLMGSLRFLTAGVILLCLCKLKGEQVFVAKNVRDASISGILLLFIGNGIVIWVEQYMATSMVAITLSSSPLWFIILDKPKWKENLRNKSTIIGLVVGFAGVVLLFSENLNTAFSTGGNKAEIGGLVLLVIGSIAWSAGSLYSKYNSGSGSASVSTAWQMIAAGACYLPISLFRGDAVHLKWHAVPNESWFALIYLIIFGSILAFSAYVWLLQVRPATQVSTYAYVNPVVAVLLGIAFAHEHIFWVQITGLGIILGSVLLINLSKYRAAKPEAFTNTEGTQPHVSNIQEPIMLKKRSQAELKA